MPRLFLVRHAQSHVSHAAEEDWPLSALGHEQARKLASTLAALDIDQVFSSPYLRCQQTVAPYLAIGNAEIEIDPDLRERTLAHGLVEDFQRLWSRSWQDFDFALPGCESNAEAQRRMVAAIRDIAVRARGQRVLVSSHGTVISLLLNHLAPSFHADSATQMRNPDLFAIDANDGRLVWDRSFVAPALNQFSTDFRDTPVERAIP